VSDPAEMRMFDLGMAKGVEVTKERIINLLEAECDCAFYAKYEIPSKCHAHKHIALIEGEK